MNLRIDLLNLSIYALIIALITLCTGLNRTCWIGPDKKRMSTLWIILCNNYCRRLGELKPNIKLVYTISGLFLFTIVIRTLSHIKTKQVLRATLTESFILNEAKYWESIKLQNYNKSFEIENWKFLFRNIKRAVSI